MREILQDLLHRKDTIKTQLEKLYLERSNIDALVSKLEIILNSINDVIDYEKNIPKMKYALNSSYTVENLAREGVNDVNSEKIFLSAKEVRVEILNILTLKDCTVKEILNIMKDRVKNYHSIADSLGYLSEKNLVEGVFLGKQRDGKTWCLKKSSPNSEIKNVS